MTAWADGAGWAKVLTVKTSGRTARGVTAASQGRRRIMTILKSTTIADGDILIEKDVAIPLLDGHTLYANVFRPNRPGTVPPIIAYTP